MLEAHDLTQTKLLTEILAELKKLNENWAEAGECEDCCEEEVFTDNRGNATGQ